MSKIIKFSSTHEFVSIPKPAKNYIPAWYKKAQPVNTNLTFKKCVPFLDAVTAGYTIELSQDVTVNQVDGIALFTWQSSPAVVDVSSGESMREMPVPKGYDGSVNCAWISSFNFKTPLGYSVLITHPFNQFHLPFVTFSGVVDADQGMHTGKFPFVLEKGFEGVIPKGTPVAQILPFKRENWLSQEDKSLNLSGARSKWECYNVISGWYKTNRWVRKDYA